MTTTAAELESAITMSFADARAFHGDLGLTSGMWRDRVLMTVQKSDRRVTDATAGILVERLHSRDLYLATSCAASLEPAWCRLQALYQKYIQELVRCLARNPLQASEVGEALLVDLFLPDRSGQSRIASYDGRSSLATWLHVIVTHRVANERVRKWNTVERPGDVPEVADRTIVGELEAEMRAQRYGPALVESLRAVCRRLSQRERQMLVWRYQCGLLLEDIAGRLSVHTSTVCRQLERLQERMRKDVVETLSNTYGLHDEAISECLDEVIEHESRSVSLLEIIRSSSPAAHRVDEVAAPSQVGSRAGTGPGKPPSEATCSTRSWSQSS
jgi:RNA polymerase sigma-70 factor (ECF subfamily)